MTASQPSFFLLSGGQRRGELILEPTDNDVDPFQFVAGSIRLEQPRAYGKITGTRQFDFLLANDLTVLVSARVVDTLSDAKVTGWSTHPVVIHPGTETTYAALLITGRTGIDHEKSARGVERMGESGSLPVWRGVYVDPARWDGSDFSILPGTRVILVTDQVRALAVAGSWTNVTLTPASEAVNFLHANNAWD